MICARYGGVRMCARSARFVYEACVHVREPRCSSNAGLMLGQRRRRWPSIKTMLAQDICVSTGAVSEVQRVEVIRY